MLSGIQYVTDAKGKPVAVQIDLREHGDVWEDFCDALVAESRKKEPHSSWEEVKNAWHALLKNPLNASEVLYRHRFPLR